MRDPEEEGDPHAQAGASPTTAQPCATCRTTPVPDSLQSYRRNNRGTHVCVFVHGYQGNATDLSLIKGQLAMLYPHIDMMCSKANEVGGQRGHGTAGDAVPAH